MNPCVVLARKRSRLQSCGGGVREAKTGPPKSSQPLVWLGFACGQHPFFQVALVTHSPPTGLRAAGEVSLRAGCSRFDHPPGLHQLWEFTRVTADLFDTSRRADYSSAPTLIPGACYGLTPGRFPAACGGGLSACLGMSVGGVDHGPAHAGWAMARQSLELFPLVDHRGRGLGNVVRTAATDAAGFIAGSEIWTGEGSGQTRHAGARYTHSAA